MKTNAIIRIVLYSLVILLLAGILLAGLGVGSLRFDIDIGEENYIAGSGSFAEEEVKRLNIEWAAGSIRIVTENTDTVSFSETGSGKDPMVYSLEDGTLTIRYRKPSISIGFFSDTPKELTVTVPRFWECNKVSVDAAAADLYVCDLIVDNFELDCASGTSNFENCNISDLDIDTASGSVRYDGYLENLDCDAASADFVGILENEPESIRMDCASGDLDLTLPAYSSFRASVDTVSGKFVSDFDTAYKDGVYICGSGGCRIDISGISGQIILRKGE